MGVLCLVGPTSFPVSIDEVRARLRIDDAEDDAGIQRLIAAATRAAENKTQRALISQQWVFTLDGFPGGCFHGYRDSVYIKQNSSVISLPLPPLRSVDLIEYVDPSGATRVLSIDDYEVDRSPLLGIVYPVYGKSWPAARNQRQAVRITFTAGYGDADAVAPDIVLAILLLIAHYDQNREAVSDRQMFELPEGVDSLLSPYVVPSAP